MFRRPYLIVVIDDDPSMLRGVSSLLRSEGYITAEFSNAAAAIADETFGQADCLLTDLQMPGMDGLALQHEVARLRPALPVILMTAFGDAAAHRRAIAAGARAFLVKPFEPERLLREIGLALHGNRG